jgi:uncharacterized protein (DUF433 family)
LSCRRTQLPRSHLRVGTGISTTVVAERFKAGEPMGALADDYGRSLLEIEEAIRCELPLEAA